MEHKCTVCDAIISDVTIGSIRKCGCANDLTISHEIGGLIIKAQDLDYVEEKSDPNSEFYSLVF